MKEASASTWTFQMIIIFMLIFAGFLALVLTYSKAFSIKNRFLSIIEKYDGVTTESIEIMNNYALNKSYKAKAKCPTDGNRWYGVDIPDEIVEVANSNQTYNYCFLEKKDGSKIYYEIEIFYKFNLPFMDQLGLYKIDGRTKSLNGANNRIGV